MSVDVINIFGDARMPLSATRTTCPSPSQWTEGDAGHTETATVTWLGRGHAEAAIIALSLPRPERTGIAALTEAERHVESLLRQGYSDREIAEIRSTSVSTVQKQIGAVYRKLGVRSRAELLADT
jgi:DNA-binding CsgD family transcriptional regulator